MAAIVERDDAASVFLQLGNPGRIHPIDVLARGKAVHQQDRFALAFVEIGNFNSAVVKARHHQSVFSGDWEIRKEISCARQRAPAPVARRLPFVFAAGVPFYDAAMTGSGVRWWP